MKNNKLKLSAVIAFSVLVGLFAVVGGVKAFGGSFWDKVAQTAGEVLGFRLAEKAELPELLETPVGAVASADSLPAMVCSSDVCTYTVTGSFIDASTTIVSIPDPFLMVTTTAVQVVLRTDGSTSYTGATSTVDLARLTITGTATSSFTVDCTAGTTPIATSSLALITSLEVASSTGDNGTIENNLTKANGGLVNGGTVAKIAVGASLPYFNCVLNSSESTNAFTSGANTLDGKYAVRFSRIRY